MRADQPHPPVTVHKSVLLPSLVPMALHVQYLVPQYLKVYFNTFYLNTFYFNTFYFKTAMSQPALTTAAQQGDNPSVLSAPASS